MEIKNIVSLNSADGISERQTDLINSQNENQPSFMTITIKEPVIGGDTNGDGQVSVAEAYKALGTGLTALAEGATEQVSGFLDSEPVTNIPGGLNNTIPLPGNFDGSVTATNQEFFENPSQTGGRNSSNVNTRTVADIALPMPIEVAYDDNINWADDNSAASDIALGFGAQLAQVASSGSSGVVGSVLTAVSATAFLGAVRKLGQKKIGVGLEPRKEMYFDGPQFREFTFNWELSPKNQTEADNIRDTINLIRRYAYPYRLSDDASRIGFEVWKLPATFLLSFRYGNAENTYIPKVKPCVISAINYNPTKEGNWKVFEGGAPVASTFSITFKEVEVLTQNDIAISENGGASF